MRAKTVGTKRTVFVDEVVPDSAREAVALIRAGVARLMLENGYTPSQIQDDIVGDAILEAEDVIAARSA